MGAPYFPTPFQFDMIMAYLGELIDGQPYFYSYTSVPTDAASYAANMTWEDTKTQPTWAYITPGGAGWAMYNSYYQVSFPTSCAVAEVALDSVAATIPAAQVQSDWTASSGLGVILHKPTLSTVATSGVYSDLTGKPMLAMVATSGSYADLSNKPAARSQSVVSHTLNSAFQVSSTRDTMATYSISIAATLSLTTGQTGTASLQISPTSGGTYVEIARVTNGQTGTLTVGLGLVQTTVSGLHGYIPAGYYAQIVTSGAATTTYITGQETLL